MLYIREAQGRDFIGEKLRTWTNDVAAYICTCQVQEAIAVKLSTRTLIMHGETSQFDGTTDQEGEYRGLSGRATNRLRRSAPSRTSLIDGTEARGERDVPVSSNNCGQNVWRLTLIIHDDKSLYVFWLVFFFFFSFISVGIELFRKFFGRPNGKNFCHYTISQLHFIAVLVHELKHTERIL